MRKRDYKEFAPGVSYHIYNRGNGKMEIFRDEQDYLNFLKRLRLLLGKTRGALVSIRITPFELDDFSLVSYCLMPTHFHLQIEQCGEASLSSLLLKICTSYSMYFNRKYDHVGHVFQDRFKAIPLESDNQIAALSAYIHQNPKTAGLVDTLETWAYSSYLDYVGLRNGDLINPEPVLGQFSSKDAYKRFVDEQHEEIRERKSVINELLFD